MRTPIFISILWLLTAQALAVISPCEILFFPASPWQRKQPMQSLANLKILTYNLEHFSAQKPTLQKQAIAQVILQSNADIIVAQEVADQESWQQFAANELANNYDAIVQTNPEAKSLNIGYLIKKTLPIAIEFHSYRDQLWNDSRFKITAQKLLFSRDLPTLLIRPLTSSKLEPPMLVLMGVHFRSKKIRSKKWLAQQSLEEQAMRRIDPDGTLIRQAQLERTLAIVNSYQKRFGQQLPIFLAGDFNGELHKESAFEILKNPSNQLIDAFDLTTPPTPHAERTTYVYLKPGQPPYPEQIDAILVAQPNADFKINQAKVWTSSQPGSDHWPVLVEIAFKRNF